MSWCLRLVERVDGGDGRSVDVIDIGEIAVPTELAMLGLTTITAKTVLAALQTEVVALQEVALTEAARRSPQPIKVHRLRILQTPFGTVALRVPRLRGRGDDAKLVVWQRHARSTPEFDSLRARLAAWMSYQAAMALLEIMEDRHGRGAAIVTSHLPVETLARRDPTLSGATLDLLVHSAHRLKLDGGSVRKADPRKSKLDPDRQA